MGRRRRRPAGRTITGTDRDRVAPTDRLIEGEIRTLSQQLTGFGIAATDHIISMTAEYASTLLRWNRRIALLSRRDEENIIRKHIAISLSPMLLRTPSASERWVDVGTGAGLPGLVLRIWNPSLKITLIEGSRRKCVFLEEVIRSLGLDGVDIVPARVETLLSRGSHRGVHDVMLVRAVSDLISTLRDFGGLVRDGGEVMTFKGPGWPEEVDEARRGGYLREGAYELSQVLKVPWGPGHLLSIRSRHA